MSLRVRHGKTANDDSHEDGTSATSENSTSLNDLSKNTSNPNLSTPTLTVKQLKHKLKILMTHYKSLLAQTQPKKLGSIAKLKFKGINMFKRRTSISNRILYLEHKYRSTLSNNEDLARTLADQRQETQHYYSTTLSQQRELQAMQEAIEETVSAKLLEILSQLTSPLTACINDGLAAAKKQVDVMKTARALAMALNAAAQCGQEDGSVLGDSNASLNGSNAGSSNDPSASTQWPRRRLSASNNDNGASGGDTSTVAPGAVIMNGNNSINNRRCRRVLPMVMGHVLQQPRLALPKMDPEALRAIARENRQAVRFENGMDMTIINERDNNDTDDDNENDSDISVLDDEESPQPEILRSVAVRQSLRRNRPGSIEASAMPAVPTIMLHKVAALPSVQIVDERSKQTTASSNSNGINTADTLLSNSRRCSARSSTTSVTSAAIDTAAASSSPPPASSSSSGFVPPCRRGAWALSQLRVQCPAGRRSAALAEVEQIVSAVTRWRDGEGESNSDISPGGGSNVSGTRSSNSAVDHITTSSTSSCDPLEGSSWMYNCNSSAASPVRSKRRSSVLSKKTAETQLSSGAHTAEEFERPKQKCSSSVEDVRESNKIIPIVSHNNVEEVESGEDSGEVLPSLESNTKKKNKKNSDADPVTIPSHDSNVVTNDAACSSDSDDDAPLLSRVRRVTDGKRKQSVTGNQESFALSDHKKRKSTIRPVDVKRRESAFDKNNALSRLKKETGKNRRISTRQSKLVCLDADVTQSDDLNLYLDVSSDSVCDVSEEGSSHLKSNDIDQLGEVMHSQDTGKNGINFLKDLDMKQQLQSDVCNLTILNPLNQTLQLTPSVMLRRFEELEKLGRRRNKSKSKSRGRLSQMETVADVHSSSSGESSQLSVPVSDSVQCLRKDSHSVSSISAVSNTSSLDSSEDIAGSNVSISLLKNFVQVDPKLKTVASRDDEIVEANVNTKSAVSSGQDINQTCILNETMDVTFAVPFPVSAGASDFLNFLKSPTRKEPTENLLKNSTRESNCISMGSKKRTVLYNQGKQKKVRETTDSRKRKADFPAIQDIVDDNTEEVVSSLEENVQEGSDVPSNATAKKVVIEEGKKYDKMPKNNVTQTEYDLSQMEATTFNIDPYTSTRLRKENIPSGDVEVATEKRLSIVLVDVFKTTADPISTKRDVVAVKTMHDASLDKLIRKEKEISDQQDKPDFGLFGRGKRKLLVTSQKTEVVKRKTKSKLLASQVPRTTNVTQDEDASVHSSATADKQFPNEVTRQSGKCLNNITGLEPSSETASKNISDSLPKNHRKSNFRNVKSNKNTAKSNSDEVEFIDVNKYLNDSSDSSVVVSNEDHTLSISNATESELDEIAGINISRRVVSFNDTPNIEVFSDAESHDSPPPFKRTRSNITKPHSLGASEANSNGLLSSSEDELSDLQPVWRGRTKLRIVSASEVSTQSDSDSNVNKENKRGSVRKKRKIGDKLSLRNDRSNVSICVIQRQERSKKSSAEPILTRNTASSDVPSGDLHSGKGRHDDIDSLDVIDLTLDGEDILEEDVELLSDDVVNSVLDTVVGESSDIKNGAGANNNKLKGLKGKLLRTKASQKSFGEYVGEDTDLLDPLNVSDSEILCSHKNTVNLDEQITGSEKSEDEFSSKRVKNDTSKNAIKEGLSDNCSKKISKNNKTEVQMDPSQVAEMIVDNIIAYVDGSNSVEEKYQENRTDGSGSNDQELDGDGSSNGGKNVPLKINQEKPKVPLKLAKVHGVNNGVKEKDVTTKSTGSENVADATVAATAAVAAEVAPSDEAESAGPSHPRRATVKVATYTEPKINSKLRQGDPISTTIYNVAATEKSSSGSTSGGVRGRSRTIKLVRRK